MRHFIWPVFGHKEKKALLGVLHSGSWGGFPSPNRHASIFAHKFAIYHSAKFGICTSSGHAALSVAYRAAGLRLNDEIIIPALTFTATASAALEQGIRPVFVDVDRQTLCIDPKCLENAITAKTKAVVAVHLGCQMSDIKSILDICRSRGIKLIEDCAHAHGARYLNRGAGSWGDFGCFSFQSSKMMTAGEGGIILTNDEESASRCHSYIDCGRSACGSDAHKLLGANYRMTEFQAAILTAQLDRLEAHTNRRHENIRIFEEQLNDLDGIGILKPYDEVSVRTGYMYYFIYRGENRFGIPRSRFINDMENLGIPALELPYAPVYQSPEFGFREACVDVHYPMQQCPVAEIAFEKEVVAIPHYVFLAKSRHIKKLGRIIASLIDKCRCQSQGYHFPDANK